MSKQIKFSQPFLNTFNELSKSIDTSLSVLNQVSDKSFPMDYGVCSNTYNVRFLTANDLSTFISYLDRMPNGTMVTAADCEMFMVSCVNRFLEDHGCTTFMKSAGDCVTTFDLSSKNCTLMDMITAWENEPLAHTSVYGKYELQQRAKDDAFTATKKCLNDLHFNANMKKLVAAIPTILSNNCDLCKADLNMKLIEEFILFASTCLLMTIGDMLQYIMPSSNYSMNEEKHVLECCVLKTAELNVAQQLPFQCDLKHIVLGDYPPHFKNTNEALDYLEKDARSPIAKLITKYSDYATTNRPSVAVDTVICTNLLGCGHGDAKAQPDDHYSGFANDPSLYSKIAYGNTFLNGNYRTDTTGNQHMDSIRMTLGMIDKMYNGRSLTTNTELANHLLSIGDAIRQLTRTYDAGDCINLEYAKDIIGAFAEIYTRTMLKLYHNNTRIIDFGAGASVPNVGTPSYMYQEAYVMEASEPDLGDNSGVDQKDGAGKSTTPKFTFGDDKTTSADTDNKSIASKALDKVKSGVTAFINWIKKVLAPFFAMFNKNHDREFKYVQKNAALNAEIGNAIESMKPPINVTGFPEYHVPADELNNVNIAAVIDKWLKSSDAIDYNAIRNELYPQGIDRNALNNAKNETEETVILTNYILYKSTKGTTYNGALTKQIWNDILDNLTGAPRMINTATKKLSNDLTTACTTLRGQMQKITTTNAEGKDETKPDPSDRATQLFEVVQKISKIYGVTLLNVMSNQFYKTNYKAYVEIVKLYQSQKSQTAKPAPAENAPTPAPEAAAPAENPAPNNKQEAR